MQHDGVSGRSDGTRARPIRCVTIPSDDTAFAEHVRRLMERAPDMGPAALGARLALVYPTVVVRARDLSGEPEVWYVYRDGAWRPPAGPWWQDPQVPHVTAGRDGRVRAANDAARALLGFDHGEQPHYSDFFVPDATEDGSMLGDIIREGHRLSATLLLRPIGGDLIACEVRAERTEDGLQAWIRLADEVDIGVEPRTEVTPALRTEPADDTVFGGYATRQLSAMTAPTPQGLALRLRRLYPHARVTAVDPGSWVAVREDGARPSRVGPWWSDPSLPRVRYDDRGFILEANPAAIRLLGEPLVGRHWQELVIPGSEDQVQPVLDLVRTAGEAVSRFRMPGSDGRLVEFDSHTRVDGDVLETTMRPTEPGPPNVPQGAST